MKLNKLKSTLLLTALALCLGSRADSEQPGSKTMPGVLPRDISAQQGEMPEVIIKGGERSSVGSERPPLDVKMNQDEAVLPILEPDPALLGRQPEALRNPRAGFANNLYNQSTILPARIRLARDPVKVFYPLREIMAVSPGVAQEIGTGWEMVVTDTEGRSLRKFSGKGLPPASVAWNGRSERGDVIGVGKSYSTVITYRDVRGQTRNYVGEPFSFDGVVHQESGGLVITLSVPAVFEGRKGADGEIGDGGQELLREAADWIKRYYFTYPVKVECFSKDAAIATTQAQTVSKTLTGMLLLPREDIPSSGAFADSINHRIDITIANR